MRNDTNNIIRFLVSFFSSTMSLLKRIGRLIVLNIAVLATINIILTILIALGIDLSGNDHTSLLIFAAVIWFSWALISLFISKWMAKKTYGMTLITAKPSDPKLAAIWDCIESLSYRHGITMPELGVYQSWEPNAFATGWSQNTWLVAFSTGILKTMTIDELEGVTAHEMAHIINGDMVTMTLLQWVINTFVVFFSYLAARAIDTLLSRDNEEGVLGYWWYYIVYNILNFVFSLLGSLVLMAFSRWREYRADAGASDMVGKHKMIAALQALTKTIDYPIEENQRQESYAMLKISHQPWWLSLFSSHPPLEKRIQALESRAG